MAKPLLYIKLQSLLIKEMLMQQLMMIILYTLIIVIRRAKNSKYEIDLALTKPQTSPIFLFLFPVTTHLHSLLLNPHKLGATLCDNIYTNLFYILDVVHLQIISDYTTLEINPRYFTDHGPFNQCFTYRMGQYLNN